MGNSTKELINAFNLNNYACDKIDTNFTVEGKKIVGLFASGTNIGEYLRRIGEEIIKRHYLSGAEVAGAFYDLNCFPFVLGANANKEDLGNGIVKVKLAGSMDPAVIHNLKIHFANEFKRAVRSKVVARLQKAGVMEEEAYEWIRGTVKTGAIGSPYLYCIAFSDEYLKRKYDSEIFEVLEGMYIQEFNSRLKECHVKSSDFYEYKDDMLYIKDVSDKVVKSVAEYVKKEVALDFRTPGKEDSKVENFKDVLSSLMSKQVRKFINVYDYDDFTDENKIKNGHNFALIPFIEMGDGQYETLSFNDARNINRIFNKGILNGFPCIKDDFMGDIRGKTADPRYTNCKEPVFAFSNKQIALLLPVIMQSPIAYNQINGHFEFVVDLENFRRRGLSRSSSKESTPTHAGSSGLRTPPNQRDKDSGCDSNSPPKPKDSVAHSSSGDPRSSFEQPRVQESPTRSQGEVERPPRRRSGKEEETWGLSRAVPGGIDQASTSSQQADYMPSSSYTYIDERGESMLTGSNIRNPYFLPSSVLPSPAYSLSISSSSSVPKMPELEFSDLCLQPSFIGLSSSKGADGSGSTCVRSSLPPPLIPSSGNVSGSRPPVVRSPSSRGAQAGANISEKEEKLIEALLYTFNLMNYTLDGVYTNFFAKDGKIVSLLHDNVDREKYFQAVIDYIIEEYCEDEEEARKVYDLNEFPFELNYEEKQEKTVVANISSGALSNLKILFSQMLKKDVDTININCVKEVEKREKDEWVDRQVSEGDSLKEACKSCFPDEGAMKRIPITFEEGEYVLDRSRGTCEVQSLYKEQKLRFKGTSVAGKGSSKAEEKTSDYYSMSEHTDHEEPSSMQRSEDEGSSSESSRSGSSNSSPESDGENTGTKLEKHKSSWSDQQTNHCSSPPSAEFSSCSSSGPSSWKGASERRTSDKPLTEKEKELFEKLLYAFNLNNYIFECSYTNFIVENGKIASLIDNSVNVKEYLQEVIDKTKKGYRVNEKEAYDPNDFPFKFLSNCEKNQETTIVANISSGALSNLKKLFIYGHEKKVKIEDIDINIVKKAVKSKKDKLVNSKVKRIEEERIKKEGGRYNRVSPHAIVTTCYPDESALEDIPIRKYEAGYHLCRTFNNWETQSLLEELGCPKGRSKTKKMKPEDNKDSGISSEEATDAGKVSTKAKPIISDYFTESDMDCGESSSVPQRSPWSKDEGSSSESSRSGSSNSSSESDGENTRRILRKRGSQSPEDGGGSPRSNLSDSEVLCKKLKTNLELT